MFLKYSPNFFSAWQSSHKISWQWFIMKRSTIQTNHIEKLLISAIKNRELDLFYNEIPGKILTYTYILNYKFYVSQTYNSKLVTCFCNAEIKVVCYTSTIL